MWFLPFTQIKLQLVFIGNPFNGQSEWLVVSSETYGLLDVDHSHNFVGSPKFSVTLIESAANELYQHASDVFWNVISEKARDTWGEEVVNVE